MARTNFGGSRPRLHSSSGTLERHEVTVRHGDEDVKIGLVQGDFREQTLVNHIANIRQQNIRLDAAVIVARPRHLLASDAKVAKSKALKQNFRASKGQHAAHALKRFTFDGDDIADVYSRAEVSEVAALGFKMMLGLVTNVAPRANISIDQVLENNPQRLWQIEEIVRSDIRTLAEARVIAQQLEFRRCNFDSLTLQALRQHRKFGGDPSYQMMLGIYIDGLASTTVVEQTPSQVVEMVDQLFED